MVSIHPSKLVKIELTPKEQKTILNYCDTIDNNIHSKINASKDGVVELLIEECYELQHSIFLAGKKTNKNKIKDILGKVFNKITPNPKTRAISEELSKYNFDDIEEVNEKAQEIMESRNTAPDPEMGGLSPEQVSRLIYLQWDDNNFPLKFNKELKLSELKHSTFFTNTTIFLKTLIEMEKTPTTTAKGNLNRKIVKILFDKIILDEEYKRFTLEYNKVINEEDVFPLHIVKIVCETAGLIHKRKNKFLVIKKYQNLISEEKAGELYHLLFNTYFTKFNIGYLDRLSELECIQQTIAYSIFRLGEIADSYVGIEGLANAILLPAVRDEIRETLSEHVFIEWVISSRIIEPLQSLGLLECSYRGKRGDAEVKKVKKTRLFDRFLGREW